MLNRILFSFLHNKSPNGEMAACCFVCNGHIEPSSLSVMAELLPAKWGKYQRPYWYFRLS
jgi:hypothetical protein